MSQVILENKFIQFADGQVVRQVRANNGHVQGGGKNPDVPSLRAQGHRRLLPTSPRSTGTPLPGFRPGPGVHEPRDGTFAQ